jgi:hypothetical protein
MTYLPPTGWVEPRNASNDAGNQHEIQYGFFHTHADCQHVRRTDLLRRVDKPYSAARCPACAGPTTESPVVSIPNPPRPTPSENPTKTTAAAPSQVGELRL